MSFYSKLLCSLFLLSACAPKNQIALSAQQEQMVLKRSREASKALMSQLKTQLKAAIQQQGTAGAVTTCSTIAPALAQQVGQAQGLEIHRVSAKNRNPQGMPDAFETRALQGWTQYPVADTKGPEEAYGVEIEKGEPVFRYTRAIRIQSACLQCHGQNIQPEVQAAIQSHYPEDQAVGYQLNELRGAVSTRIALNGMLSDEEQVNH